MGRIFHLGLGAPSHQGLNSASIVLLFFLASCGGGEDSQVPAVVEAQIVNYGSCGNTPNYLSESGGAKRWRGFPLTVAIDVSQAPGATTSSGTVELFQRAVRDGAAGWAQANGLGSVIFIDGKNADISIEFGKLPNPLSLGQAEAASTGLYRSSAKITINNSPNLYQFGDTEQFVRHVTLHEIGHAFFLPGHSTVAADVMSAQGSQARPLTERDLNSFKEAYCKPV